MKRNTNLLGKSSCCLYIKTALFPLLYVKDFSEFQIFIFQKISTVFRLRLKDFHASKPSVGRTYKAAGKKIWTPDARTHNHDPLFYHVPGLGRLPHIYPLTIRYNLDFHRIPSSDTTWSV